MRGLAEQCGWEEFGWWIHRVDRSDRGGYKDVGFLD